MNEKKKNVIVNGFFWRFAERCGVQLISAVVSILLARILTPDDYGKVALVTVFNNIMYVLLDCGIGTARGGEKEGRGRAGLLVGVLFQHCDQLCAVWGNVRGGTVSGCFLQ